MTSAPAFASSPFKAPEAPAEVTAAAPAGTMLLSFASIGDQPNADAAAVFETAPDKNDVRPHQPQQGQQVFVRAWKCHC